MRIFSAFFAVLLFLCFVHPQLALCDSTDKHIQDLKSEDPDVRAKAAFDLGCS
ncbi:MAG: hypothetical protein M1511_09610 [Deltaproteobacteria bacterium]|nr:hypothetical protein [Deltaproteobacteria bacterium]